MYDLNFGLLAMLDFQYLQCWISNSPSPGGRGNQMICLSTLEPITSSDATDCSPHLARMLLISHAQFFGCDYLWDSCTHYNFLTILSLSIWSRWIQNINHVHLVSALGGHPTHIPWGCSQRMLFTDSLYAPSLGLFWSRIMTTQMCQSSPAQELPMSPKACTELNRTYWYSGKLQMV